MIDGEENGAMILGLFNLVCARNRISYCFLEEIVISCALLFTRRMGLG